MLLSSCTIYGPFPISKHYGAFVDYDERRHAGLDFNLWIGTPIIAATEGVASYPWLPCLTELHCGDFFVELHHGQFRTLYGHLKKVYIVEAGQAIKRGQLIGLSGESNQKNPHLHFVVLKTKGPGYYSNTYDPAEFWLGGKPQCFDPNKDYTTHSVRDITLPVACGEYAKKLKNESRFLKETN